ncbi:MAG: hypothetical protein ABI947_16235 [Chloroflexota bacterium]
MKVGQSPTDWEYEDFVFQKWHPGESWMGLEFDKHEASAYVRSYLWNTFEDRITAELQTWRNQGWELAGEVGPAALQLQRTATVDTSIDAADVVLWIATAGLALIVQILMGSPPRTFATYVPTEFRVPMRRLRPSC